MMPYRWYGGCRSISGSPKTAIATATATPATASSVTQRWASRLSRRSRSHRSPGLMPHALGRSVKVSPPSEDCQTMPAAAA